MKKVMVVDDDLDLREMTETMVKKEGYLTATAENGQEFLQQVEQFSPDVVVLDVMMPGLSTKEILERLSKSAVQPKIILFTAILYSEEEKEKIRKRWNVVEYLQKPFDADQLLDAIHQHTQ